MVREEEGKIILDNGVSVKLINEHSCPKCKQVSENNELCYDCQNKNYPKEIQEELETITN